jgi:hypothetical protein
MKPTLFTGISLALLAVAFLNFRGRRAGILPRK